MVQKEDQKLVFKTDYRLMQVKSIAECSKGTFCNTFDLDSATICHYHLFCLFLSGRLSQVLLYFDKGMGGAPYRSACLMGLYLTRLYFA